MKIVFNKKNGQWKGINRSTGKTVLEKAEYRLDNLILQKWSPAKSNLSFSTKKSSKSTTLTLKIRPTTGYIPTLLIHYKIHCDSNHMEISWSIINHQKIEIRCCDIEVINNASLFSDHKISKKKSLKGGAGASSNLVEDTWFQETFNSLMLTGIVDKKRETIVVGGLGYSEFARKINVQQINTSLNFHERKKVEHFGNFLSLDVWDPQGKRIAAGETYRSPDSSYIDFITEDPFLSLEQYGKALATANNAKPHPYDFPTLCGWMVEVFTGGKAINHSSGLINEVEIAEKNGLLKYTPLAARLEPDFYCYSDQGDTQQGWWDDEHFVKYGALSKPYNTFEKFCKGVTDKGGIPFTYMQVSMPSNDFAIKHPEWMLNNDISRLHYIHAHHKPFVRYDFTDSGFQKHMRKVWKYFKRAGLKGIKFDYPETAWAKDGGFDDLSYTTSSAYRKVFSLCKEGLGSDSYIHERNLGGKTHENAPCLDITAGIVDLQRVWGDASHFEAEMASRMGLRWYKSRSVFHYYPDGKSFIDKGVAIPEYQRRSFLSLIGFLGGRLEIGTSIGSMDKAMFHDTTRLYPIFKGTKSPRPVDMLCNKEHPEVYDYEVSEDWHQVLLVNNDKKNKFISTKLAASNIDEGGLNLKGKDKWHAFDFWSQKYLGCFKVSELLKIKLRSGESAMISLRRQSKQPQLISTNRHFMQGMVECHNIQWKDKSLVGSLDVIGEETFVMSIALNSKKLNSVEVSTGTAQIKTQKNDIVDIMVSSKENARIDFRLF